MTRPPAASTLLILATLALRCAPCPAEEGVVVACAREQDSKAAPVGEVLACVPDGAFEHGVAATAEPSGQAVGARVLWSAPGEPVRILFDASADAASYRIRPAAAASAWEPRAGVAVECRRRVDGPADTWEHACELWKRCTEVQGVTLVPNVFQGCNPCGDTRDYSAMYRGWFQVRAAGEYRFSTVSDDASFIAVDGRVLVQWGGWHGIDGGREGEHGAAVTLQAGEHLVEYLYFQSGDNPIVELAWQPPGQARPAVMPAEAFMPVARYRVVGAAERPWSSWDIAGSARAGGQGLVDVELRAHLPAAATRARWSFDDGSVADAAIAAGAAAPIHHAFARSGPRQVRLEAWAGVAALEPCVRTIAVHPLWTQLEECPEAIHQSLRADLIARDAQRMPADDLLALVRYSAFLGDAEWIGRIGKGVLVDAKRWGPGGAALLAELGFQLQDPDVREYQAAADCWRALLSIVPGHPALREHAALHCGGLLIHCLDLPDEAAAILAAIDPAALEREEPRLLILYRGDAALAKGDVTAARACYETAGDVVKPGDLGYAVRRRTRLEAAKDWCARGEYEQALQALREIEWETPGERLATETGLLKVRAHLGRKELRFALACCRHLLIAVGPDEHRAEVLLALVRTELACQDRAGAEQAARALIKDHPYSEAAATAKDLVPEARR